MRKKKTVRQLPVSAPVKTLKHHRRRGKSCVFILRKGRVLDLSLKLWLCLSANNIMLDASEARSPLKVAGGPCTRPGSRLLVFGGRHHS